MHFCILFGLLTLVCYNLMRHLLNFSSDKYETYIMVECHHIFANLPINLFINICQCFVRFTSSPILHTIPSKFRPCLPIFIIGHNLPTQLQFTEEYFIFISNLIRLAIVYTVMSSGLLPIDALVLKVVDLPRSGPKEHQSGPYGVTFNFCHIGAIYRRKM